LRARRSIRPSSTLAPSLACIQGDAAHFLQLSTLLPATRIPRSFISNTWIVQGKENSIIDIFRFQRSRVTKASCSAAMRDALAWRMSVRASSPAPMSTKQLCAPSSVSPICLPRFLGQNRTPRLQNSTYVAFA
jgi:hypothetical protein